MTGCLVFPPPDQGVLVAAAVWLGGAGLTAWVWRQHVFAGKGPFLLTHLAMLGWLLAAGAEMASDGLGCKMLWAELAWPAIILTPTAWVVFLVDYTLGLRVGGRWTGLGLRVLLFAGVPLMVGAMALTNPWHGLMYGPATRLADATPRAPAVYDHGPMFYAVAGWVYGLMLTACGVVVLALRRAPSNYRVFLAALLAVTAVPFAGNLAYVVFGMTIYGFDVTPFMFAFVLAAFGWLIVNNRMMDVNAIARDRLFYQSADPILIVDTGGRLVGGNPEAWRVLGADLPPLGAPLHGLEQLSPLVGRLRAGLLPDAPACPPLERAGRVFDPRVSVLTRPLDTEAPGNGTLGKGTLGWGRKGQPRGWAIGLVDITAQSAAADELRRAAETAEAATLAKTQFLSTVSHELRTPLTAIKGTIDLLNHGALGPLPDRAAHLVRVAAANSLRLARLIDDLLDLQQIEQGHLAIRREPIDLTALLREAAEANECYGSQLGVRLRLSGLDRPVRVNGDPVRLMQVMGNVLSNAFKVSAPGDVVDLSLEVRPDHARVLVHDTGIGIPPGARDKVFGAFAQVDSSNTRRIGGSGLGLHISRWIIEQHDGLIDYDSEEGVGTTFHIDLPRLSASGPDAGAAGGAAPGADADAAAGAEGGQNRVHDGAADAEGATGD